MPKSVPLRAMATSSELFGMSRAASKDTLLAGMERLRKKWSLPLMNSRTAAAVSGSGAVRTTAGAMAR